jgi:hypothetical protein
MTSLFPQLTGSTFPGPQVIGLSDDEQALVTGLSNKLSFHSVPMKIRRSYYEGLQRLANLGIAVPAQLANIRTVVDWPRICVDPLVMRQQVDSFWLPGSSSIDEELQEHWEANNMPSEAPLCFLDSLVCGRGYMIAGAPDSAGDSPIVTVESPLNVTMNWDARRRMTTAAYQAFEIEGIYIAVLYLPDQTISMSRDQQSPWVVDDRDQHNFGEVPVVRFANRQMSDDREGKSEISAPIMNTTDSATRTLLGMEIAREFYSVPHRYVMGATESDFIDSSGAPKTALDLSMNKFLAFARNDDGNLPSVGQFAPADPSVFTKIIDEHAQLMSSYTQFPPSYFGQVSTANPASADAIRVAYDGMNRRGKQVQVQNTFPLKKMQRLIWRFANGGAEPPEEMKRLSVEWVDVETFTPGAMSDAIYKQASMGAIPSTSDIVLKRLGWSKQEREQLAIDRELDAGASVLAELATSLQAKEARVDLTVAKDINPNAAKPVNAPATGPVVPANNVSAAPKPGP